MEALQQRQLRNLPVRDQPTPKGSPISIKNHIVKELQTLFPQNRITYKKSTSRPPRITFPEDPLRLRFYKDHPFELTRVQCLDEMQPTSTDSKRSLAELNEANGEEYVALFFFFSFLFFSF
jgi:hypothetical protein